MKKAGEFILGIYGLGVIALMGLFMSEGEGFFSSLWVALLWPLHILLAVLDKF